MSTSVSLVCSSPRSPPPRGKLPTLRPNSSRQRGHGTSSSPQPNRLRSPPSSKRRGESNARWGRSGQARKRAPPHSELVSRAAPSPSVRPTQQGGGTGPRCSACFALPALLPSRKAKRYRVCAGAVVPSVGHATEVRGAPPTLEADLLRWELAAHGLVPRVAIKTLARGALGAAAPDRATRAIVAPLLRCGPEWWLAIRGRDANPDALRPAVLADTLRGALAFLRDARSPWAQSRYHPVAAAVLLGARLGWSWLAPPVPMLPATGGGGGAGGGMVRGGRGRCKWRSGNVRPFCVGVVGQRWQRFPRALNSRGNWGYDGSTACFACDQPDTIGHRRGRIAVA